MNVSNVQVAEATQTTARPAQATAQAKPATPTVGQNYYFSPTLKIDPKSQKVVLDYLNSQTGEVTYQYPSEKALAAYQQPTAATPTQAQTATQTVNAPTASATGTASSAAGTAQAQVSTTASILA